MKFQCVLSCLLISPILCLAADSAHSNQGTSNLKELEGMRHKLESIYAADVKSILADSATDNKSSVEILTEEKVLSTQLLALVTNADNQEGSIGFDIILNAQDWVPEWSYKIGKPVANSSQTHASVQVSLNHGEPHKSFVTWIWVKEGPEWKVDDIRYEEKGERTFSLREILK